MKRIISVCGILIGCAVLTSSLSAKEPFQTLSSISVEGNTISAALSGPVKYHAFTISNPPRIVLELSNTVFDAKEKEIAVDNDTIKRVRSGQFQNEPNKIVRVVADLNTMATYEVKGNDSGVQLIISGQTAEEKKAEGSEQPEVNKQATTAPATTDEEFSEDEEESEEAPQTPSAAPLKNEVTAAPAEEQPGEAEAPAVKKPAPEAPKKSIAQQPAAKPAARPAAKAAPAKQARSLTVTLPKKPITVDFEDADIRDVLRVLSMKSGVNIIFGSDVTGTVTLRLDNVPFDKAFETILSLKSLVAQDQGANILRVATPQKIAEERSQAVTFTKVFPLNYAKAEEVKNNLDIIRNAEGRRGNISVDDRTNSLVITDTPEGLVSLERIIQELDKKPAQVLIEAKIIEVVLSDNLDLGIDWQYSSTMQNGDQTIYIGGTKNKSTDLDYLRGVGRPINVKANEGGTGVNLPATAVNGMMSAFNFGIVSNNMYLSGQLSALAQKGLSKLLSNPKVTTINNKEARILVGEKLPYTEVQVQNGAQQFTQKWIEVGIKMTVTPTINSDQKITLAVRPEVSILTEWRPEGPVIGTREANTTIIVQNGETVVIGGLISEQEQKMASQVPLMGDLPVIGHLFKRDFNTKKRTELLVFLTPQIVSNY